MSQVISTLFCWSHCTFLCFKVAASHCCVVQAIVGFFEAGFEGPQHCEVLKTGPQSPPTHWKQTVFYLQDPIPVQTGKLLNC